MKIICTLDCEDVKHISDERLQEAMFEAVNFGGLMVPTNDPDDADFVSVTNITVEVQR